MKTSCRVKTLTLDDSKYELFTALQEEDYKLNDNLANEM